MILQGLVWVNGTVVNRLGAKIEAGTDRVEFEGKVVEPRRSLQYILLNKPKGFVSTAKDDRDRKSVLDLVATRARIYPVGRLDIDSTGLLLLTNDGEMAYRLMHPKFRVAKVYQVSLDRRLQMQDEKKLEQGIVLEEGQTAPCTISFPAASNRKLVRVTLRQGWKRQIRRMFAALDYKVCNLSRIEFGCLKLNGLAPGNWRNLSPQEIRQTKQIVGL
ncbi:MAG: pseudouridine synthase [bacterium]